MACKLGLLRVGWGGENNFFVGTRASAKFLLGMDERPQNILDYLEMTFGPLPGINFYQSFDTILYIHKLCLGEFCQIKKGI